MNQVKIVECDSFNHARDQAVEAAANTNGIQLPIIIFRQGDRNICSGAITMKQIRRYVDLENTSKRGDSPSLGSKNRPKDPQHQDTICKYLVECAGKPNGARKGKYILPGVIFNAKEPLQVFTAQSQSTVRSAYLVLPDSVVVEFNDGQHRGGAIVDSLLKMAQDDREYFGQDGLPFMLTCETDPIRSHQDFADCSKTKPLPPSMLTSYDRRIRANALVLELIEKCPVSSTKSMEPPKPFRRILSSFSWPIRCARWFGLF
jgi:hypothetical protein